MKKKKLASMDDNTQKVQRIFDNYASLYEQRHMTVETYHSSLSLFGTLLPHPKASILEIGCGPGNITSYLLAQYPQLQFIGVDLSEKMIERAKNNNPSADFEVMDARDIHSFKQQFEGIVCGFLLPYISELEVQELLNDANHLLSENGIIYLSTMEDDYEKSKLQGPSSGDGPKIKMHYYREKQLHTFLTDNGFKHLHTERHPIDGTKQNDLVLIAQKI